jgi:DNA repair photolyase
MTRFTGHAGEKWGDFLDVKQFDPVKIKPEKYDGKTLLLSSVTDPYLPLEKQYENTRKILERMAGTKAKIVILTKSKLVTRDIDLFQGFEHIQVGVSLNTLDPEFAGAIEPSASSPAERLAAIETVKQNNVATYVFLSPMFPRITNYQAIIERTKSFTDEFWFENLNLRPHNIGPIRAAIKAYYPELSDSYEEVLRDPAYWEQLDVEIRQFYDEQNVAYDIDFHFGGFSKSKS